MKQSHFDLILIVLLLALITVVLFAMHEFKQEGMKCVSNPIKYQMNSVPGLDTENISCFCNGNVRIDNNGIYVSQYGLYGLGDK